MALADPANSLRVAGRLCVGPTDISLPFPHGGTSLGVVADVVLRINQVLRPIDAEEFGGEIVDDLIGPQNPVVGFLLRGLENDAVEKLFPASVVGGVTGDRVIREPGGLRAGRLASTNATKLLFSPRQTAIHPAAIFFNAYPLFEETAELRFTITDDIGFPMIFRATRDGTGRIYEIAKLADIVL